MPDLQGAILSDIIDDAQVVSELFLQSSLRKQQQSVKDGPVKGTGACLSCGEAIADERKRWCDASCRDEWQRGARP